MSLKILHYAQPPIGEYDGEDSIVTSVKGGEVVSFTAVNFPGTDQYAGDVADGYSGVTTLKRPAVTNNLVSGMRPLFLVDDGIKGYGTWFGEVVGGQTGKQATGGAVLGPHTASGSGKLTLWSNGSYVVTFDTVDQTVLTGLVPTNTTIVPGAPLYATTTGKLTPNVSAAFETIIVGRFVRFVTSGSLVNTQEANRSAPNSPVGLNVNKKGFIGAELFFGVET